MMVVSCKGLLTLKASPKLKSIPWRLSAAYSVYMQLTSMPGHHFLYSQPEDAAWHGIKESLNIEIITLHGHLPVLDIEKGFKQKLYNLMASVFYIVCFLVRCAILRYILKFDMSFM